MAIFDFSQFLALCAVGTTGPFVFLYFGPETFVPLATFIASVVGLLLMFWRYVVSKVRKAFRFVTRKGIPEKKVVSKAERSRA